ncbi:MAG: cation transporter [Planctomycetia bacterium]|nr:cation transporter [Planctomycetia bacterium]MCC7313258.1 cation transporter [Planctomycetota bacterium]OQZ07191.1 MAG: hypothetical protein B6D36_01165 [Planctomycetes bacterium UTPLA1]
MSHVQHHTTALELRAAAASVCVGVVLLALKFAAYLLTGSAAIFSDALESIVNVLASAFTLYAVRLAHQPADEEHPYGHGKVEFMSAGFEGGLILIAALVIAFKSLDVLLFSPMKVEQIGIGLGLVTVAMTANGAVGVYLIRLGRSNGSMALEASGKHLLTDAITSVTVLVALVVIKFTGWTYADPIVALVMAAYIARMGVSLLRRAAAGILDEQDPTDARKLERIMTSHVGPAGREPRICSFHKLRHRHAGRYHWVDFHAVVPARLNVEQGHTIASAIEYEIEQKLGHANATGHIEPCVDADCANCRLI